MLVYPRVCIVEMSQKRLEDVIVAFLALFDINHLPGTRKSQSLPIDLGSVPPVVIIVASAIPAVTVSTVFPSG